MCELKAIFKNNDYNAYIISNQVDCILYDLNFILNKMFCNNKYTEKIRSFLFLETYFKNIDILIFCVNCVNVENKNIDTDLKITLSNSNKINLEILFDEKIITNTYNNLNKETVNDIYVNIIKLLGDIDG